MNGYTKLFQSILASTIWNEPNETRLVWITLLAMADKEGVVEASVPGLAVFARVSDQACRKALKRFMTPDRDSRSPEFEGRRIEPVSGGWRLLNHGKYRAKMGADERREYNRVKQAEYRRRKQVSLTVNENEQSQHIAEAKAEADKDQDRPRGGPADPPKVSVLRELALGMCTDGSLPAAPDHMSDSDLREELKIRAARAGLSYNGTSIAKAIDAARGRLKRTGG